MSDLAGWSTDATITSGSMPETMWLQWFFLGSGPILGFIALFWLRRTGQLRLW